jgi:anti-anti-sigma factor
MADFAITAQGPPIFFLEGELDMATVPLMNVAIADGVARGGPITLDMSKLTFIDSTGVGGILKALKDLPSGCINLHGVHGGIQEVIDLMRVGQVENLHVISCTVPV